MAFEAQITDAATAEQRYAPRLPVTLDLVAEVNGEQIALRVGNVSHTGFVARTAATLPVGSMVTVSLPGHPARSATVVWRDGGAIGCTFATPIPRAALSAFLLKSDAIASPATPAVATATSTSSGANKAKEKWSPRSRLALLIAIATVPWLIVAGVLYA